MNSTPRKKYHLSFYFPLENSHVHSKTYLLSKATTEKFVNQGLKLRQNACEFK